MRPLRWLDRLRDSDLYERFRAAPLAVASAAVVTGLVLLAAAAPWVMPHDPFDPAQVELRDSERPPFWLADGRLEYPLGTDNQGRDVFSSIFYGTRISLLVGVLAVLLAMALGIVAGLTAGYVGGKVDVLLMRVADVQLTFPAILVALLIDGVLSALAPGHRSAARALGALVLAVGLSNWVQFARVVRGATLVKRRREYVQAAFLTGMHPVRIMVGHILPNTLGPTLVIATVNVGMAVLTEATLSFLGVGLPPTSPSLGTLIRIGNDYLFSGSWWMVVFPALTLVLLVLSVNLLGDWLRDVLNPKLR